MIAAGRRTGGPTGARSGSMGARTAGAWLFGDLSPSVEGRPRKGRRPKLRRMLRACDRARPMSVATPSNSARYVRHRGCPTDEFPADKLPAGHGLPAIG